MFSAGNNEKAYRTHLQEYSLAESVGNQIGQSLLNRIDESLCEMHRFEGALEYAPVEVSMFQIIDPHEVEQQRSLQLGAYHT